MSTTVDQRVVEMRFDNKHFESNVQTTMSTLDKLKQKLNLSGASKGLEELNVASKKVDMHGLGAGVEAVSAKFSALQVVGVTALANITNSAVNTGKKMMSALTIDPIKTGFQEYETQMNAVQTILANTQSKGSTLDDVNNALDLLNVYADKTIYNFTEMTRNIGTFTAAGVDLQTSVDSIKGIANLAAVSGSSSQQASTAMYQLSQALAAGRVSLMDWNSVVNAGMGGELFQNALIRTSELLKTGAKDAIATYGSFRESLTQGEWLTTEVLTETLKQLSGAYSEADLIAQGFTEEQAKEITQLANTAVSAATEVKTFTQLWDVMKESAQSGWSQTWKLLVGDFEEAKALLTPLADFFAGDNGIITKFSNARNELLKGALGKTFTGTLDKIKNIVDPIKKSADSIKKVVDSVKDYGKVVDEIIGGKWGNGQERWDKLAKSGYDWAHAQNLVNEKLGDATRHATNYKEAQNGVEESQKKTTDTSIKYIAKLAEMSESQLKAKGYTDEQIKAFKELAEVAEKTGIPLEEFIENIDGIDGRYLLINSLKNVGKGLVSVFTAIGKAWRDAFPPMQSDQLFDIIAGIHKLSTHFVMSTDTANNLTRTLKGVFAIIDIITTIVGGGFKIAFKIICEILSYFDLNILDVTANIGDAIVKFRDWFDSILDVSKILDVIVPIIKNGIETVKGWIKAFLELPKVQKAIQKVKDTMSKLKDIDLKEVSENIIKSIKGWIDAFLELPKVQKAIQKVKDAISNLKDMDLKEIGKNIIDGLMNGLGDEAEKVVQSIIKLGEKIIQGIKDVLGIHSPSTVFFEIGKNIIEGLVNGLSFGLSWVIDAVRNLANKITDIFSNANWDFEIPENIKNGLSKIKTFFSEFDYKKLLAIIPLGVVILMVKKFYDLTSALADGINGINDVIEGFVDIEQSFSKVLNSLSLSIKADAMKKMVTSIAILAGVLIALTFIDTKKLHDALAILIILAGVMAILALVMDNLSNTSVKFKDKKLDVEGLKTGLIGIGITLLLLAATVKIIGSMNWKQAIGGFIGLTVLMGEMLGFLVVCGLIGKDKNLEYVNKVGSLMIKLSIALMLMVGVCKLVGTLSPEEMIQGGIFAAAFAVFVRSITVIGKDSGANVSKVGSMVMKIAMTMMLMVGVCKLVGTLSTEEMLQGGIFAAAFVVFVKTLVEVTKVGKDQQIAKLGGLLLSISISLMLMVGICKLVGKLSAEEMIKGGLFIGAFLLFIKGLVSVTAIGNEQKIAKLAGTLVAMSIAIGLLAGISILLSLMPLDGLAKGVIAVTMLGLTMAAMIKATQGSGKVVGNIIAMSVAVAVMAGAVVALSFIDSTKLAGATGAVTLLMGMFALIAKAASTMGKVIGSLITMTIVVGLLAGIIYLLSKLPVESTMGAATSLSILLLSLSTSMAILNKPSFVSAKTVLTMGLMTLVVGALAGILYLIKDLPVQSTLANATALSILLMALSGCCVILGGVGMMGPAAFIGVGALLTLIVSVGALIVAIGALSDKFPKMEEFLNKGIPILEKIGYGLGSFFGNIIGGFSEGVTSGLPGIADNLTKFMDNLDGFINGAKNIGEDSLNGIQNLAKMMALLTGASMLDAIANFIPGYDGIDGFSEKLNAFGDAIIGFSSKLTQNGGINETAIETASNAGLMMAELQNALPKTGGLWQSVAGEKDLAAFGQSCIAFGNAIVGFSNSIVANGGVNESATEAAAKAGTLMAELQNALPKTGGWIQTIVGEKDLAAFGQSCIAFGNAISKFSSAILSNGGVDLTAAETAAKAGLIMAELQNALPKTGGWIQTVAGEKDLTAFGLSCVAFGNAISKFSNSIVANGGVDPTAVEMAAKAGKLMSALQQSLPKTGGWIQEIVGEQDLANFGSKIKVFGESLATFSSSIGAGINEEAVKSAQNAGLMMAELQDAIPTDKWLDGKVSLDDFGTKISSFGASLVKYSNKVSEMDTTVVSSSITQAKRLVSFAKSLSDLDPSGIDNFKIGGIASSMSSYNKKVKDIDTSVISSSISSANRLKNLINNLTSLDTSGISKFKVSSIGTSMKSYATSVSGIDSGAVSSSISSANKLKNFINSLTGLNTAGVESYKSAIESLGEVNIDGIIKAFAKADSRFSIAGMNIINALIKGIKSRQSSLTSTVNNLANTMQKSITSKANTFGTAGKTLMSKLTSGITSMKSKVTSAVKVPISAGVSSARSYYNSFYNAGSYLVSGFASGISANTWKAEAKAKAMANAAEKAAREALDINSPSKVFKAIGAGVPEGFAMGIGMLGNLVKNSTISMTSKAIDGTKNAISRISDAINTDIDSQPTIRPVLDLSDIKAGAGTINDMFGMTPSIETMSNLRSISSMMNQRNQNGTNNDIISELSKLRKTMGNVGGNTYQINGITYDDGSTVSEVIGALIRAINIERRV